jgi:adenosylcobyric acid synthase
MTARAIMIQGTGSDVGKSMLVAGLCRAARRHGLRVAPFKPQNMSNNAAATDDGGEIGRAQALQARAAGLPLSVDMNPVLLKPETETGAQIVVQGRVVGRARAREYAAWKPRLLVSVLESFRRLSEASDLVIVEGAGSPAEINLRRGDIANMGFAEAADIPVALVADIERGGVIANLVGTHAVLDEADRARIAGFLVNKFRGDVSLFDDGVREIESRTGWRCFGIAPWFPGATRLPAEDAVGTAARATTGGRIKVAVPRLPRIAQLDDLDPLRLEPEVTVDIVEPGRALPGDADLVLLPGSKSTLGDLAFLRAEGWDIDIAAHVRRGGRVLGLCGGYQILGRVVRDPAGIEGPAGEAPGLGLLDIETDLTLEKTVRPVTGRAGGLPVHGYEIHIGETVGPDTARPLLHLDPDGRDSDGRDSDGQDSVGRPDGAVSADGRVEGCYVHGLLQSDAYRAAMLARLGASSRLGDFDALIDTTLDELATHLEASIDVQGLFSLAR